MWLRRIYQSLRQSNIEAFMGILCVLFGAPAVFYPSMFASLIIVNAFGLLIAWVWAVLCVIGGACTLLGVARTSIEIQRAGLVGTGTVWLLILLATVDGGIQTHTLPGRLVGIVVFAFFTVVCLLRFIELGMINKSINRATSIVIKERAKDEHR